MVQASAYKNPHHVMLFFEQTNSAVNAHQCLSARANYYDDLKSNGKVVMSGNFWNQDKNFIIVYVSNDAELEQIISNDPAVQQNVLELVRAMPF
ncbi:YCII-related domain-containing protein [Mucilaginibacter oryzae]|uniref:YCII-related domain-containing protein n=1 Tax=Mucilaginibacter oryzae TaxID=468058 RepID=A0A316HHZ6_9SPHI|nr:YciI family protein [Mucilaginibacter oryzae]PWK79987.1 YCII-related domain-containing protein [Mucilaginibacter oryzae]